MTLGAVACHSQSSVPVTEMATRAEDGTIDAVGSIEWLGWGSTTRDSRSDNFLGEARFRLRNNSSHTVYYAAFDDLQPSPKIEDLWPGTSGWHVEEWNTVYRHERIDDKVIKLGGCLEGVELRELLPGRALGFSMNIELARFKYFDEIRIRITVFGGPECESPMDLVSQGFRLDTKPEGGV